MPSWRIRAVRLKTRSPGTTGFCSGDVVAPGYSALPVRITPQSAKLMFFRAFMACVRVVVLAAILGAIVFVIYDNSRSGPETANTAMYTVPKAGDTATLNNNTVACPTAADALKVKDLLRTFTDRQPAATYSLEHGCSVLIKQRATRSAPTQPHTRQFAWRFPIKSHATGQQLMD